MCHSLINRSLFLTSTNTVEEPVQGKLCKADHIDYARILTILMACLD